MTYNLGTAQGEIITTYNGKGVDAAQKDIDGLQKKTGGTKGAIQDVGNAAGVAGLAIAAGFGLAVNSAASFEARMSAVKAVSGASAAEMDQLTKKALQLGKDTSFSAGEAAQAIEELVKAGVSIPDVMNGAADATVALAAAGEIALPEAAAIASNAMNQFNLKAQDMPKIADLIAGAANASAIDVKDFGFSLSQVGAVANLAGASFADTATAIALMGNAGIKGSDAGTSLKTMLSNLQPATEKQATLFKELGLITEDGSNKFYDAQGNLKSFADIAAILQGSLKGMTAAQKQAALETLFGSDAIRAAAIFANQGATGFNNMAASMNKVKAADVAKTRLDNFKGSLEAMKGSLETAGIVIGQILLPALRSIVDTVTGVLNSFLSLDQQTQGTILAILGIVGAALLVMAAIVKVILVVGKIIEILKVLRLAFATTWVAALGPIALIIVAIAAVVAIFIVLWNRSEAFRGFFIGIWNAIKAAVEAVVNWFTGTAWPALQAVWNGIITGLQAVGNFFTMIWNAIVAVVTTVVSVIATIITTYVNIWKAIITAVVNAILGIWRAFWNTFGGIITAAFNLIVQIIKLGVAVWQLVINTAMKAIQAVVTVVWNAIKSFLVANWNAIKSVATSVFNAMKSIITSIWNNIKSTTTSAWNAVKSAVITAINAVKGPVSSAVNTVKSALTSAWNAVKSTTSSIWNALSGIVGGALGKVLSVVNGVVGKIKGVFAGAGSWLYNAGRNIIKGLLDGIESLINAVTSKLKALTDKIPKVKGPESRDKKLLRPAGRWIMEGFADEIERQIEPVLGIFDRITDLIPNRVEARTINEVMPALGLPSAADLARSAQAPAPAGKQINIDLTTVNPVGKTTVEELSDQASRLATLGVL